MAPLQFTEDEFARIRQLAEAAYGGFGQIRCPYFGGLVNFNTNGFRHLIFKRWNRGRDQYDQFMRLKHLALAPEILSLSRTVQGIQETHDWQRRRRHGRWEKLLVPVTYYEFIAVYFLELYTVLAAERAGNSGAS